MVAGFEVSINGRFRAVHRGRWRSFTVPMTLGIGGTVVAIMLLRTLKNIASTPHGPLFASVFPWSLPYVVLARQATSTLRGTALLVGICRRHNRRDPRMLGRRPSRRGVVSGGYASRTERAGE